MPMNVHSPYEDGGTRREMKHPRLTRADGSRRLLFSVTDEPLHPCSLSCSADFSARSSQQDCEVRSCPAGTGSEENGFHHEQQPHPAHIQPVDPVLSSRTPGTQGWCSGLPVGPSLVPMVRMTVLATLTTPTSRSPAVCPAVPRAPHVPPRSVLPKAVWGRCFLYSHFTQKDTKA